MLAEVKTDPGLRTIPIVVFTTSQADQDITYSYELGANCYVSKPAIWEISSPRCNPSRNSGLALPACRIREK